MNQWMTYYLNLALHFLTVWGSMRIEKWGHGKPKLWTSCERERKRQVMLRVGQKYCSFIAAPPSLSHVTRRLRAPSLPSIGTAMAFFNDPLPHRVAPMAARGEISGRARGGDVPSSTSRVWAMKAGRPASLQRVIYCVNQSNNTWPYHGIRVPNSCICILPLQVLVLPT